MSRKDGPRAPGFTANRRLDTDEVLAVLLHEGVLTEADTKRVRNSQRGAGRSEVHPLVMIANAKLEHRAGPRHRDQPRVPDRVDGAPRGAALPERIDPTKIDVSAVGQVVTAHLRDHATASCRSRSATPSVTVATSEPFDTRWIADLGHITAPRDPARGGQSARRQPLPDGVLRRHPRRAQGQGRQGRRAAGRVQAAQLRAAAANWASPASSAPTTSTSCTSSTGCCSTPTTSAPATSISSRGATSAAMRFRIDGVLHKVFELPTPVMTRGHRAHQDPRPHGHRRAPPPAGWPHQDALARRARGRDAPVDHADRLRREVRDAHLRPRAGDEELRAAGLQPARGGDVEGDDRAPARHRAGHRPDRFRQDHHAVFDAQAPRDARHQRLHDRGPDRDGGAGLQPDAGAGQHRPRPSPPACARCCARIPTSSWSARSATCRPPRWRCRPR